MQFLFNSALDGNQACYFGYDHANNLLYLVNDNNTALLPAITQGTAGVAENSQCYVSGVSKFENGTGLTLYFFLEFKPSFIGPKVAYTGVQTISGANSGWHAAGVWVVAAY